MFRFRVSIFLLLLFCHALLTIAGDISETKHLNTSNITHAQENKNITSRKDTEDLLNDLVNLIKGPVVSASSERRIDDLAGSASEHVSTRLLSARTYFNEHPGGCYSCNSVPWIPIAGRSLNFPTASSHSSNVQSHFDSNVPYFQEKPVVNQNYGPPVDQYGAPQGSYDYPRFGDVVDYMVPPPFKLQGSTGQTYGPPRPLYLPARTSFGHSKTLYKPPNSFYNNNNLIDIKPPLPLYPPVSFKTPIPSPNYGPPLSNVAPNYLHSGNSQIATTHLRPVSGNIQPPVLQNIQQPLPLETTDLPPAIPSDSYGKPLQNLPLSGEIVGSPSVSNSYNNIPQYVDTIASGSGDSENYSRRIPFTYYRQKATDVQVIPSVRLADYTASIQHPINLIQSPILDLNLNDQILNQEPYSDPIYANSKDSALKISEIDENYQSKKLHDKPIAVDDTYTSATNLNSTYTPKNNYTTIKRDNELFSDHVTFEQSKSKVKDDDLSKNLIHKLILEQNIIPDPKNQIVSIEKTFYQPEKLTVDFKTPSPLVYDDWITTQHTHIPTKSTKLINKNVTFVTPVPPKTVQIIVPYLKAPDKDESWLKFPSKPSAIYNKEYTTLAPVFVPPPVSTENFNLWTELAEEIKTIEAKKKEAQGFIKPTTTEVYNIKEYLENNQHNHGYDGTILQKNIDDWTRQSYANGLTIADKLTTKLTQIKNIPQEYFTTTTTYHDDGASNEIAAALTSLDDPLASSSNNREIISNEIDDNSSESTSFKPPAETTINNNKTVNYKFVVKDKKPTWEANRVTLSNSTHEKVYVVTPQIYTKVLTSTPATAFSMAPKIQNGEVNNATTITKISVRVEGLDGDKENHTAGQPLKVVYSEWPHLINDLETTTTQKATSRHPLFGLMDLAPYTESPSSPVDTQDGHSKVTHFVSFSTPRAITTTTKPSTKTHFH